MGKNRRQHDCGGGLMAEIRLKSTGTIKLFENDNTSNITIASPASLGADRTITLPDASVTLASGTMLATDGSGASLTALNASELGSGTVPTARLGSGTASSSTILYGDQTYKTAPSGGLTFLQTASGSSTASMAMTGYISATYRYYKIYYEATPTAAADCIFTFHKASGAISGANFDYGAIGLDDAGNTETSYGNNQTSVQVGHALKTNTEIDDPSIVGRIELFNPANASNTTMMLNHFATRNSSGDVRFYSGGILYEDQDALTGFALSFSSGDVYSGKMTAYGMKDS